MKRATNLQLYGLYVSDPPPFPPEVTGGDWEADTPHWKFGVKWRDVETDEQYGQVIRVTDVPPDAPASHPSILAAHRALMCSVLDWQRHEVAA